VRRHGSVQFTYFQQVAGFECAPVSGELTYGSTPGDVCAGRRQRLYNLNFHGRDGDRKVTYGDGLPAGRTGIFGHNFEYADTGMRFEQSRWRRPPARNIGRGWQNGAGRHNDKRHSLMALPALRPMHQGESCLNLLDARGVIRDRAAELYPRCANSPKLRRRLARDRRRAGVISTPLCVIASRCRMVERSETITLAEVAKNPLTSPAQSFG